MADIGAYLFLIALFAVLFGLPAWLMLRHHKKSKVKIENQKKEQAKLTPAEVKKQWHQGHKSAVRVLAFVAGYLIGSRLIGGVLEGLILGIITGLIGSLIADYIWKDK